MPVLQDAFLGAGCHLLPCLSALPKPKAERLQKKMGGRWAAHRIVAHRKGKRGYSISIVVSQSPEGGSNFSGLSHLA